MTARIDEVTDFPLPLQGRPERLHLYRWVEVEEGYAARKFDTQRDLHDVEMEKRDMEWWTSQVVQYLDRAKHFLDGARQFRILVDDGESAEHLERKAQQAMAKCMMTAKGMCESSIRVFGYLPKPGLPSGEIEKWDA